MTRSRLPRQTSRRGSRGGARKRTSRKSQNKSRKSHATYRSVQNLVKELNTDLCKTKGADHCTRTEDEKPYELQTRVDKMLKDLLNDMTNRGIDVCALVCHSKIIKTVIKKFTPKEYKPANMAGIKITFGFKISRMYLEPMSHATFSPPLPSLCIPSTVEFTSSRDFTVFMIRHGQSINNVLSQPTSKLEIISGVSLFSWIANSLDVYAKYGKWQGRQDPLLSWAGAKQASNASEQIIKQVNGVNNRKEFICYVSPLRRAIQTAMIVFGKHRENVSIHLQPLAYEGRKSISDKPLPHKEIQKFVSEFDKEMQRKSPTV